jgi:hypothetical protein
MRHEFCVEVLDFGPGTDATIKPGRRAGVDAAPVPPDGIMAVGYSNAVPGGYGELMVLSASLLASAERARHRARRDDGADGRRPARRREGAARSRRCGDGVRLRPGQTRRHRGAEAQGRRT